MRLVGRLVKLMRCGRIRTVYLPRALRAYLGQIYVLVSRCTDPDNFELIGVPPVDMVEDVYKAMRAAGWDADEIFSSSTTVGGEWNYDPCRPYEHRFYQKRISERTVPMTRKTLEESLSLAQFCFASALFIATRFFLGVVWNSGIRNQWPLEFCSDC